MEEQLEKIIANKTNEYQQMLAQVIQIPSVKGKATNGAPFGSEPKAALEQVLKIAASLGLEIGKVDDQVGWAQLTGQDENYIAVLGHLDVVAAGEKWQTPPYQLTLKDDYMYGRGVLDNKGPIMGALFALALLKEQGIKLKRTVRVIFGTDEESGSQDILAYLAQEQPPIAGFTPDGKYPVVYAERGLLRCEIELPLNQPDQEIHQISGNFDPSYIPDEAQVEFRDGTIHRYHGKKAPSNAPELGDNVIRQIAVAGQNHPGLLGRYFQWLSQISADTVGENLGVAYHDDSGDLQLSVWGLELTAKALKIQLTIRYPVTLDRENLVDRLTVRIPSKGKLHLLSEMAPLVVDPELPMIKIMREVYEEITKTDGTPVTTTGATYARSLPNIVAFGPSFPGQRGIAHKENEWLKVSDWQKMIAIDYLTMKRLAQEI